MWEEMLNLEVEEGTLMDIPLCSPEIRELLKILQKRHRLKISKSQEIDWGYNSAYWLRGFR